MTSAVAILSQKDQSDEYNSRLQLGLEVFVKNNLDYIVLLSESCNQKNIDSILEKGITEDRILLEPRSKDTIGEAYFLKHGILLPNNIEDIHVVTSDYHMAYRAKSIFDYILSKEFRIKYHKSKTSKLQLRESIAGQLQSLKYFIDLIDSCPNEKLLINRHPLYNVSELERKK